MDTTTPRRGRPALPEQARRSERVTVRLTPPERELLDELLVERGHVDTSDLLRAWLHEAAGDRMAATAA